MHDNDGCSVCDLRCAKHVFGRKPCSAVISGDAHEFRSTVDGHILSSLINRTESFTVAAPDKLEREIKELIVRELALDDITSDEIDSNAPLFGEGLGLDSIDALELTLAIERRYGVKIEAEGEDTLKVYGSIQTLADHVRREAR